MASPLATVLASAYAPPGEYRPGTVAPTNVADITANSTDAAYKNYAAQLQKQNAMFGGIAGLGSAGILGFGPKLTGALFGTPKPGAPGMLSGLFSSGGGAAGSAAADATTAGAIGGAGSVVPLADAMGTTAADAGLTGLAGVGSDAAAASLLAGGADAATAAAPVVADAGFSLADILPALFAFL